VDDLQRLAVEEIVHVFNGELPTEMAWANRWLMPEGGRILAAKRAGMLPPS
jgi:hypothetical protein